MLSTAPVGKLLGIPASRPSAFVQGLGFTYLGKILVGSSLTLAPVSQDKFTH